jgi:hypothetical protein
MRLPGCSVDLKRTGIPVLLWVFLANAVKADELKAELPADGCWVRYRCVSKRDGDDGEIEDTDVFSLVGTVMEDGKRCRWVEWKTISTVNGEKETDIFKFLIPERELVESDRPLEGLIRAWRKSENQQAEPLLFNQALRVRSYTGSADFTFGGIMLCVFRGPKRNWRPVDEKRMVEYQRGRLEVGEGRVARHQASRTSPVSGQKIDFCREVTVWSHPHVPFGGAAVRMREELLVDNVLSVAYVRESTIEDFGADAQSAIPDNN